MKTRSFILVIVIMFLPCMFFTYNVNSQTITKEQAFFYFVKIYNYNVTTHVQSGGGYSQCGSDLLTHYAYVFDKNNYLQSRNDEFTRREYWGSITAKFNSEFNKVNFDRKFSVSCQGTIGEYSFENSSFPIVFTPNDYNIGYRIPFYNDDCFMEINVGGISNLEEFKWELPYPVEKAKILLSNRKNSDGRINRTIYFKLYYSILNQKSYSANYATNLNGSNIIIYLLSIGVYNDKNLTDKLGSLQSTISSSDILKDKSYIYYPISNDLIIGEWEGKGEATGSLITISKNYDLVWKDPSASYSGSAESIDQERKPTEHVNNLLKKIERNMGNDKVTICNKNMSLSLESDKGHKTILVLYQCGSKIFAWAGGESYFEKK